MMSSRVGGKSKRSGELLAQKLYAEGINNVAVTAGYVCPEPRQEFYQYMDAVNVDLKAFTERFYHKLTGSHLQEVLETIQYINNETKVWMELTTLLIPGENDSEAELNDMTQWIFTHLGPDVPLHFSVFHPDWKMKDKPSTQPETVMRAREIAIENGIHYAYVGNMHDKEGDSTWCYQCGALLIARDWYDLCYWNLSASGNCPQCGTHCEGVFEEDSGMWGAQRVSVTM